MKMYLISDNIDTLTGMRLAGVEGVVVHEEHEVRDALAEAIEKKDVAAILITEKLVDLIPDYIKQIKLTLKQPLIVEIPDRHGTSRPSDLITRRVRESIGLKI
ncbi:ATP synthase subunit F [Clostridium thermosuccinogenes]|uniref:ATP synthase subunit F n=1 Tax=Clostridium thermosuccinogenes TaxID=84032 RepID=A0A2K2F108_9CLOT|nr:V-type ATP synthase subunit F [Pseudoclostridium thermosuccinogenes]AUS96856.1 ATP synthase subunit F [Pseudoclostridium thermosuccinogenes]PNT92477.1 ATP synthase subunit F [Pseudoclostridium thermosuccinogenes]PNT96993.1 ATP synthase subunit F [Pseudoclostridium thermosuccinogenes]PNT98852.1 ATP synthase subunit F [Pseudoclostridium thermosuccinogenes]